MKRLLLLALTTISALAATGQEPPAPPGLAVKARATRDFAPRKNTEVFATVCPHCNQVEALRALSVVTNGGACYPTGSVVNITVTLRSQCGEIIQARAERSYLPQPHAIEVAGPPDAEPSRKELKAHKAKPWRARPEPVLRRWGQ